MCFFKRCNPQDTYLLHQILMQLMEIKAALGAPVQHEAVELNLQAGTPEPIHGFMNVKGG